ncbi:Phosphoglycerate dehydrogenase [Arthrobacter sp. 31Cvi3.1E]|nr:Phosphoglycerate dehydrogenase [Arthrobacter sp. 31Cvi3.1E]
MTVMSPPGLFHQLFSPEAQAKWHATAGHSGIVFEDFESPAARRILAETEVLITGWGCPPLTQETLDLAPHLKAVIHAGGVISDKMPPLPLGRDIKASNAGEVNGMPVAEYTVAMILLANKQAFSAARLYQEQRRFIDREQEFPTAGNYRKVIGLIGASRIGRMTAKLLQPFEFEVWLYDPYLAAQEARELGVKLVSLHELMAASDVVSIHVPVTPETTGMIGAAELAAMRPGATLINTARGEILDQDALEAELVSGRIHAILDVAVPDVLPAGHILYELPNVVLTPHIAGSMGTELQRMGDHVVAELERYAAGLPFTHPERLVRAQAGEHLEPIA